MIINTLVKDRIVQVINVFETGTLDGQYDTISIYADGKNNSRQITFGRSQTTEQGNLKALLEQYIQNFGLYADSFKPYMSKVGVTPLVDDKAFIDLLKKAAQEDAIMRETQDVFFDNHYYKPALKFCFDNKFALPLSMLVIYDSYIHSGGILQFLRNRFPESPPVRGGNEQSWVKAYVRTRHNWLSTHSNKILQKTIYRTECFQLQMALGNWHLSEPINAHGTLTRSVDGVEVIEKRKRLTPAQRKLLKADALYDSVL
jgi:chitosanase